jgi:sugar lactone lactonase YvrE
MNRLLEDILRSHPSRSRGISVWPAGNTGGLVLLLCHLALGALVLGSPLSMRAQTDRPEEYTFTTLAGPPETPGAIDGTGSVARFHWPSGVAADSAGNVYVADTGNCTIRKVTPGGVVTTLAGDAADAPWVAFLEWRGGYANGTGNAACFNFPEGVAVDGAGNVYVADTGNHTIRKVTPAGAVTTLAGDAAITDEYGFPAGGYADGTGSAARFSEPRGVAVDSANNLYVADSRNYTVRQVTPAGVVTTLAGCAGSWGSADGIGSAARFGNEYFGPSGVAVDSAGNVYVADTGNYTIRKVTPQGVVTTLAGLPGSSGSADGAGSAARFGHPTAVAVDKAGNVFVTDGNTIRQVTPEGVVTTLAGSPDEAGSLDGTGSAARFSAPCGVAVDTARNLYVADSANQTIRKITPEGVATTLAGLPGGCGFADGTGSATRFWLPFGVAADSAGNVCVADYANRAIRKVTSDGVVTTLAKLDDSPNDVAVDKAGNLFVTHFSSISKVTSEGVVTTLAISPGEVGGAPWFDNAWGLAMDGAGNLYVADCWNQMIRKVTPEGLLTTLAGSKMGSADGPASEARFNNPRDVAVDSAGNVYVADTGNHTIRKVTVGGVVTTLAGLAGSEGSADGTGSAARFYEPWAVAVDRAGNVYVGDSGNTTIRKVTPSGVVTTLAGLAGSPGSTDGTGSAARFGRAFGVPRVMGLAIDSVGKVYVADTGICTIRVGTPTTCPDQPRTDLTVAPAGVTRQLDTCPQTAVTWQWSLIRQPAASTAALSDATVRNPTFMPDVPDLYVFRLKATNAAGAICIRTLELTAVPTDVAVLASPQRLPDGSFQFTLIGQTNLNYTVQVSTNLTTWTDWTNAIPTSSITPVTDPAAAQDPQRFYRALKR